MTWLLVALAFVVGWIARPIVTRWRFERQAAADLAARAAAAGIRAVEGGLGTRDVFAPAS